MFFNKEYEQALLGALLIENENIDKVSGLISVGDFTFSLHKKLYREIDNQISAGQVATIETMAHHFPKNAAEIVGLTSINSSANIEFYAEELKKLSSYRQMMKLSEDIQTSVKSFDDPESIKEKTESVLTALELKKKSFLKTPKDVTHTVLNNIDKLSKSGGMTGVPSGYIDLDYRLGGFQPQELIILGARPGIGKTSYALNVAEFICRKNIAVGFFSLEMSAESLMLRMISGNAGVPQTKIKKNEITDHDRELLQHEASKIYDLPLYFYDNPDSKLSDIKTEARRMKRSHDIKIIFLDYISLINESYGSSPRWEVMMNVSRSLKSLARELDIPVIALSQLKRETEGKKPNLADLRETGALEQDADIVMFLHRGRDSSESQLIVEKARNASCGVVDLHFEPTKTRFYSVSKYGC